MEIQRKLISYNKSSAPNREIKYIVMHTTGNSSIGANAEMHYRYFNGGDRQASADFFVDDLEIIQCIDYPNNYSWAVGDGGGKYGITNQNSISIEMCVNKNGDFQRTLTKTIELVSFLMSELNITYENVIRHYDASRKNCPAELNYQNWQGWINFKNNLALYIQNKIDNERSKSQTMSNLRKELNIPDATWAASEIEKALSSGILNTKHDPNEIVTFGVLMTMINKLTKI